MNRRFVEILIRFQVMSFDAPCQINTRINKELPAIVIGQ